MLPVVRHHEVVVLMMASLAATMASMLVLVANAASHVATAITPATLMIICGFDIDTFLEDPVTFRLVLPYDLSLDLLGLHLVIKAQQHEAEATTPLGHFLAHHDRILHLAKFLEVVLQVRLRGRKGKPADEKLDLILLSWLVKGGRSAMATASVAGLGATQVATRSSGTVHPTT